MFSFLKKKPKDEQTLLVCLVTSYAVTGSVVKIFTKPGTVEKPVVLFSCESIIPLRHGNDRYLLEELMGESIKQVLNECRTYSGTYDKLVCSIGEPWVRSTTRNAHLEKREAFPVTRKLVSDLIARETKIFEQETIRDYLNKEDVGIIGSSKPVVDINGYRIENYENALAASLDVHITFSIAPASLIDQVMNAFTDVFHRTDVVFESFDIAKNHLLHSYTQGVIIDFGGVSSAITIFDQHVPKYFASIPTGLSLFEESLAYSFEVPRNRIGRVLSFARDENILEHEREIYFKRIAAAYRSSDKGLLMHLALIKKHIQRFEEPVIVIGHPAWLPVMKPLIEQDLGVSVIVPHHNLLKEQIFFTHEAHVVTNMIALAIIYATRYEK